MAKKTKYHHISISERYSLFFRIGGDRRWFDIEIVDDNDFSEIVLLRSYRNIEVTDEIISSKVTDFMNDFVLLYNQGSLMRQSTPDIVREILCKLMK